MKNKDTHSELAGKTTPMKLLIVFEHVIGASIAQEYLKSKGIIAEKDELPKEGDAKLWVDESDYDAAIVMIEQWKEEVQNRFNLDR